jgi:hypothetical protein
LEIRFLRFLYFPMKNIHEDVQNQEPDLLQATSLPLMVWSGTHVSS